MQKVKSLLANLGKITREVSKNKIFQGAVVALLFASVAFSGYYYGFQKGSNNPKEIKVSEFKNLTEGNKEAVDFNLFWDAWSVLKEKYVDANKLDNQKLLYGAINGMLIATGDEHTTFFSPEEAKSFGEEISGEFSGIGIEIGVRDGLLTVISPLKDTPAYKVGLKAGDIIVKIDNKETSYMSQEEAVKKIRGPKGTKVTLTISREGLDEFKDLPIIRDTIQVPTLDFEMKGDIAYIRLYNFYDKAQSSFIQAAIRTLMANAKGIVLDLRNNPGGYLDTGINISAWFLEEGKTIVSEDFASGEPQVFKNTLNGYLKDIPVVILVNEGTASASEILAGALRDNRGVKLIGEKTYGKGTVQELVNLTDGSEMKVTIAHWVMPSGKRIEKNGLIPDYEVKLTDEDYNKGLDPQLDKAMEVIKSLVK